MENMNIKNWYVRKFPKDELGHELNNKITFKGLFKALDNYKDVYEFLGVGDSIIRERVFEKLAEIMNVEYDYIYKRWLKG